MDVTYTCVIIEDEPLAQELIEKFIKRIPSLTLIRVFDNAIDALEVINEISPDIIFLDISMPEMTGIEFIRSFTKKCPNIIFTTAYPQYAIDGFEYDAVDYLLKPIPFDRFVKAINKVRERSKPQNQIGILKEEVVHELNNNLAFSNLDIEDEEEDLIDEGTIKDDFLWVKESKKLIKIDFDEIIYVEGMKDYLKIYLPKKMVITHMTMGKMEKILFIRKKYIRINRSFIVNSKHIISLDGNMIELEDGTKLMIGITYREVIKNAMRSQLP